MALPLIVSALTASAIAARQTVRSRQGKAIEAAKQEVAARINQEVASIVKTLVSYQRKSLLHLYLSLACLAVMLVARGFMESVTVLVALAPLLLGVYLLTDFFVLYTNNPDIRNFQKEFLQHWKTDGRRFNSDGLKRSTNVAIENLIRDRFENEDVKLQIRVGVDKKLASLKTIESVFYDVFGNSREEIARRIYQGVMEEVDFEDISKNLAGIIRKIFLIVLLFSSFAFLARVAVLEMSGIEYGLLALAAVTVFLASYLFHLHRQKNVTT